MTILANLLVTGAALLLMHRGPNRRLKMLTLTVGLLSLAQTASYIHQQGMWEGGRVYMAGIHQLLVAALSLLAIYLLGMEILDRNATDRRLRLVEHEVPLPAAPREKSLPASQTSNTSEREVNV